jgi:hypothetical protein
VSELTPKERAEWTAAVSAAEALTAAVIAAEAAGAAIERAMGAKPLGDLQLGEMDDRDYREARRELGEARAALRRLRRIARDHEGGVRYHFEKERGVG